MGAEIPSQVSKPARKPQVATNPGGEKIDSCVIIRLRCFSFLLIAIWVLWLIFVVISGGGQTM